MNYYNHEFYSQILTKLYDHRGYRFKPSRRTALSAMTRWLSGPVALFFDCLPGGAVKQRFLKFLNRFTIYSILLTAETWMVLDSSPHNRSDRIFRFLSWGRCGGRAFCNLKIDSQPTVFVLLSWNLVGWYSMSVRTIVWSRIFRFSPKGRCEGAHLGIFNSIDSLQ